MNFDIHCPLCSLRTSEIYRVSVSPFLRQRMYSQSGPKECLLLHCDSCHLYYYDIRPEQHEMALYYNGYRSEEYQQQRQRFEKNYSADFNKMIGDDECEVTSRCTHLEKVLFDNGVSLAVNVLDYGGNDGRFIPQSITGRKHCYDISHNIAVPGVSCINESEMKENTYDLILLCHVLEHIPYPKTLADDAISVLNEGGYLYVELPYEMHLVETMVLKNRKLSGRIIAAIKRNRPQWMLPRNSFGVSPGYHEHVNYFTIHSLECLLSSLQLNILEVGTKVLNFGWAESTILYGLAQKNNSEISGHR